MDRNFFKSENPQSQVTSADKDWKEKVAPRTETLLETKDVNLSGAELQMMEEQKRKLDEATKVDLARADEMARQIIKTGTISPELVEVIPQAEQVIVNEDLVKEDKGEKLASEKSEYLKAREKRIDDLYELAKAVSQQQAKNEAPNTETPMPENLMQDDVARSTIELQTMREVDTIYELAKPALGRALTPPEEEMVLTTLDYALKRIINAEMVRSGGRYPDRRKYDYFGAMRVGLYRVLPGDRELVAGHDLVHVVLALKQGIDNENSPVPTFMQETQKKFNSDAQAMLEEAFAIMFTIMEKSYDDFIKNPQLLQGGNQALLDKNSGPFFKNEIFSDETYGTQAKELWDTFLDSNQEKLASSDSYVQLILYSQIASVGEALGSDAFDTLSPVDKLSFLQKQLTDAQQNMGALLSGEIPPGKDEKYRKTVAFTRETFTDAQKITHENPHKPVFVEILLKTLKPLYAKAKAQAETTFNRLENSVSNEK